MKRVQPVAALLLLVLVAGCGADRAYRTASGTAHTRQLTITAVLKLSGIDANPLQGRPSLYEYTVALAGHGRHITHLITQVDGLSGWTLLLRDPLDPRGVPRPPDLPLGTCEAYDRMPRLLFHTASSSAWDWGTAWRLSNCTAWFLLRAKIVRPSPPSVTVYGGLTRSGAIDPKSWLATVRPRING